MNILIRSETRDDIIIVIVSNIFLAFPAALIKIFVCCDVQCERDLYEDIRNMHHSL